MNLKDTLLSCANQFRKTAKKTPGVHIISNGRPLSYMEVADEIERVCQWVYPNLETEDICAVVRCKNCEHYKRFRKKGSLKLVVKYLCELDKKERSPDFYCADGIEKEEE